MSRRAASKKVKPVQLHVNSAVLEILRKPISYVPPSLRISKPAKEFQLFEVLSAYIMSLIESDFQWTVTPLQHDGGVDFYGERELFRLPGLEEHVRMVIAGQCKASRNVKAPLPSDLWRLLHSVKPAIVFIFLMSDISKRRVNDAQEIFVSETHRQCRILGLHDVVRLVQLYRREILDLLHRSLSSEDEDVLRAFIEHLPSNPADSVEVKTRAPEKALAGTPFYVHVNVHSLLLCKGAIRVRWNHPPEALLIKPAGLTTPEGLLLEAGESFCSSFSLKLVSYHVGEVSLGELVFEVEGKAVRTVPLGSLVTIDQYHPIFYWEPYQRHRTRFVELLEKAEAHAPEGVAVTGQGGAGKTRLCQELGYLAEQRGAQFISISHPQDLEHPYKIFGSLTQELLSNPFDALNPKEALESYLLSLHPKLYQSARSTIGLIFSSEERDCGVFDREAMLQVLLVMLLQKAKSTTYVLHLSDLHWAGAEALDILGELLQRLGRMAAEWRASVLILFEGRAQTSLKYSGVGNAAGQTGSTATFESFVERYRLERLDVTPFSTAQSRAFLEHLFENTQSASRRVPRGLIPHQEALIGEVARYGQGNPFHMIEQIKLLRQEGVVARNQRTGLIYLTARPKSSYRAPASVHELISLRLKFIEDSSPELGLLIKAVGLIKDRIEAQLFRRLRRSLASHTPDSAIQEVELLNTEGASEVGFRHENYYQVVRGAPLSPSERRRVTELYLSWYDQLRPKTAEALYEEALVHTNREPVELSLVRRLLKAGLRKAEGCHQYQLAVQIINKLLDATPPARDSSPSSSLLTNLNLRIKLADFSDVLQDWNVGAEQLERVIADIDRYLQGRARVSPTLRSTLYYLKTNSTAGVANSKTDLGQAHQGVRLLTEARKVCETYFELGLLSEGEREKWAVLHCRILNRLGEANWMDGNYAEALRSLEAATAAIEETIRSAEDRRVLHHVNFLDYGAVLLHESPAKAVEMLRKSISLIPEQGWSPRLNILAGTTLVIGEMVELFLNEGGRLSPAFRRFLAERAAPQLQKDFEKAMFYGFKQEQAAASLMLGVSLSLLGDPSAAQWYMESIETAFRSNNLESLWRGHLNLAQHLAASGEGEASIFHCNRARQLLSNDLGPRAPQERKWRQRHLRRPFMRIASLLSGSESAGDPFILAALEQTGTDPSAETQPITANYFSDKIIFLWDESNEYYPYGG
jgi:tetratricopeptide (TPR) repeat protein